MIEILSSVADRFDQLVVVSFAGIQKLLVFNTQVVSGVLGLALTIVSWTWSVGRFFFDCLVSVLYDSIDLLHDVYTRAVLVKRLLAKGGSNVLDSWFWVTGAVGSGVRAVADAVYGFWASIWNLFTTFLYAFTRIGDALAFVANSFLFSCELVAFLVKLAVSFVVAVVKWCLCSVFFAVRYAVVEFFASCVRLYSVVAGFGRALTFGLVSGVKFFPVDAFLGFLVILAILWLVKKGWRPSWTRRLAGLWRDARHLFRLVFQWDVEFRDDGSDGDVDGDHDLWELDYDGESVISAGDASSVANGTSRAGSIAGGRSVTGRRREGSPPQPYQGVCVICQDKPKTIAIMPCRHLCLCETCQRAMAARRNRKCPICRVRIENTLKLYL